MTPSLKYHRAICALHRLLVTLAPMGMALCVSANAKNGLQLEPGSRKMEPALPFGVDAASAREGKLTIKRRFESDRAHEQLPANALESRTQSLASAATDEQAQNPSPHAVWPQSAPSVLELRSGKGAELVQSLAEESKPLGLLRLEVAPKRAQEEGIAAHNAPATDALGIKRSNASDCIAIPQDPSYEVLSLDSAANRRSVVVIDPTVADYETLLAGLKGAHEVLLLDAARDGMEQLIELLAGFEGPVDTLHIVSHGEAGVLFLGSACVDAEYLERHKDRLESLRAHLAPGSDISLYACEAGSGEVGEAFVSQFQRATNANIAASHDLTGAGALGGNWELEVSTAGRVALSPFSESSMNEFRGLLSFSGVIDFSSYLIAAENNARFQVGNYILVADGADHQTYQLGYSNNNDALAVGDHRGNYESKLTLFFEGGATFDVSEITIINNGSPTDFHLSSDKEDSFLKTVGNSGATLLNGFSFTGISKLYITAIGGMYAVFDNLVVSNVSASENRPPVFTSGSIFHFPENASGTVADVNAHDGDGGEADVGITYSITGGTDGWQFVIDPSTGVLAFKNAPDFENPTDSDVNNIYQLIVTANDGGSSNNTATQTISIVVTDVNEPPSSVLLTNVVSVLPDSTDTSTRIKVADIVVIDDFSGVVNLSIAGGNAGFFEIDGNAVYLKAGVSLSARSNPILNVTVLADDPDVGLTPDVHALLTIVVTDITPPYVVSIVRQAPLKETTSPVGGPGGSVMFRVTFSEPVTNVDTADFALTGSAASGASVLSVLDTQGDGTVYDVLVSNITQPGDLGLSVIVSPPPPPP